MKSRAAQEDARLTDAQRLAAQVQYAALARLQERYDQILDTCGDKEAEREKKAAQAAEVKQAREVRLAQKEAGIKLAERARIAKAVGMATQPRVTSPHRERPPPVGAREFADNYERAKEEALGRPILSKGRDAASLERIARQGTAEEPTPASGQKDTPASPMNLARQEM